LLLQRLDLLTDGSRRDVQLFGRLAETQVTTRGLERPQPVQRRKPLLHINYLFLSERTLRVGLKPDARISISNVKTKSLQQERRRSCTSDRISRRKSHVRAPPSGTVRLGA